MTNFAIGTMSLPKKNDTAMCKLILHIFIACSILIFMGMTSCAKKQGNANSAQPKVEKEIDSLHLHPLGRIIEDTIVGPWMLKTIISPNDALVKSGEYTFGDSSVFVTLSYKNHPLFTDKEIRTKDLMDVEHQLMAKATLYRVILRI